ncbi:hypothetical protein ACWG0Q_04210 [Actinacidiphila sp. SB3-2]
MLSGIRGLRLEVAGVRAKFKCDDQKPAEHRSGVAGRLAERGRGLDAPAAHQQRRRLDRIGTWNDRPKPIHKPTHKPLHRERSGIP